MGLCGVIAHTGAIRWLGRPAPRSLVTRRALIAAELVRKDAKAARIQLDHALATWRSDGSLRYLSGVAHHLDGDNTAARTDLLPRSGDSRNCALRPAVVEV